MDITMCKGEGCPVKEKCKRFTAEPGMMQSYFVEVPGDYEDNVVHEVFVDSVWKCDMFWGEQQEGIMSILKDIMK